MKISYALGPRAKNVRKGAHVGWSDVMRRAIHRLYDRIDNTVFVCAHA